MTVPARVLVVCEAPAVRLLIQQTLEHAGCTAIAAESCRTATGLGNIDPPHLILLDERTVGADADAFQAVVDRYPDAVVAALAAPVRRRMQGIPGTDCLIEMPVEEGRLLRAVAWSLALQEDADDHAPAA